VFFIIHITPFLKKKYAKNSNHWESQAKKIHGLEKQVTVATHNFQGLENLQKGRGKKKRPDFSGRSFATAVAV